LIAIVAGSVCFCLLLGLAVIFIVRRRRNNNNNNNNTIDTHTDELDIHEPSNVYEKVPLSAPSSGILLHDSFSHTRG
jgi:hypothetical protein